MAKHLRLFPFVGLHARAVLPQRPAPPGVRPPPQEERKGFFGRPEVPRARTLRRRLGSAPDCFYHLALDFLVLASEIIEGLPRGRSHLSDQFSRASLSIVLNLAEGAGKNSKPDKRRYYLTARGSATESAALLDVCRRLNLLEESGHRKGSHPMLAPSSSTSALSWLDARTRDTHKLSPSMAHARAFREHY